MEIKLNFINQSNDIDNTSVVIFQKNVAVGFAEIVVAWHVIQNCGQGDNHPFSLPMAMQVSCSDSWGNFTPKLEAEVGQLFEMVRGQSGDLLAKAGSGSDPSQVQVLNNLSTGTIDANIYRADRLLATRTSLVPEELTAFEFRPTIWIGTAAQIVEGDVMNLAIVDQVDTELSLLGIASADIVMTGGGGGAAAQPFSFTLENIVRA